MRVWLADDKQTDLVPEINEFRQISDPDGTLGDIHVLGIGSRRDLMDRVAECIKGKEPMPDVIFLDLRFDSREDGIDALKFLKYHKAYDIRNIPVIIYSQSESRADVYVTISFRANAYMTKEGGLKHFWDAVSHWRSTQLAPHRQPADLTDDLDEPKRSRRKNKEKAGK